ncbi:MAG: tetratricopeptide repeat protein, partial [Pseudomonadota bacterium]
FWRSETFPHELPQGIGCQRCHGPGGDHVRAVLTGRVDDIHASIVNPSKLSGAERDSVCFQCHLLPSAAVEGVRSIGRGIYSFRPGQRLTDYIVNVDIGEEGVAPGERFEINHHGYRLTQSSCYRESAGELTCISCHNPHEKPDSDVFRARSSEVCAGCHVEPATVHTSTAINDDTDCIGCHMPRRRTSDVIEVTMTDHRIARGPFDRTAIAAPVAKQDHAVTGISVFDFGDAPDGEEANLYRYLAALRANRFVAAGRNGLEQHLDRYQYDTPEPYIDLIKAQLKVGDFKAAENEARALIDREGRVASAYNLLGTALLGQGRSITAIAALNRAVELEPDPEAHFNLAAAYLGAGEVARADAEIDRALELRPYMGVAWRYRGLIRKAEGKTEDARKAFVRALQIEPRDSATYVELVSLLREQGDTTEAERFLELGLRASGRPDLLAPLAQSVGAD